MKSIGLTNNGISIFKEYDLKPANIHSNCRPLYLQAHSIKSGDGELSASGALSIRTGKYTGRAPKDRYIVIDNITSGSIDWGKVNKPYDRDDFIELREKMVAYMEGKEIYQQDVAACADPNYQLKIRLLAEKPWSAQFATNMFLRIEDDELITFDPQWYILCVPSFTADPDKDNTRSENFVIIDFSRQEILIGGTGYTGEIKKSIFSVLNFLLPREDNVLPMHCSATEGKEGDTAIYFGLSGTGKTTLSADKDRILIGDDEHGWSDKGIFNFEGGCYAKCIGLTPEKEPEIYNAIKDGAILENIIFNPGTRIPNYSDQSITQNTRVSYPIYHIPDAKHPSMGGHPKNIFFLTCDAFGVLPPISKMTPGQAMYHFISGYTAKVAGTEEGVSGLAYFWLSNIL